MIGNRIKDIRKNLGLTQKELANKTGLTRESIGNYERGDRTPDINSIIKISKALNVEISDITLSEEMKEEFISSQDGLINHNTFIKLIEVIATLPSNEIDIKINELKEQYEKQTNDLILDTITLIISKLIISEGFYSSKDYFQYFIELEPGNNHFKYEKCEKMFKFLVNQVKTFIDNDCDFS